MSTEQMQLTRPLSLLHDADIACQWLDQNGFVLLKDVFSNDEIEGLRRAVMESFDSSTAVPSRQSEIKNQKGSTYAARNLLDSVPLTRAIWRKPNLVRFIKSVTGTNAGLVRGLFFDKHPERTWSLGWHKDLTIAVQDNEAYQRLRANRLGPNAASTDQHQSAEGISKPTRKSGVAHVEADPITLSRMATLRIRLDPVTSENGPLQVIPGSHRTKQTESSHADAVKILSDEGHVLVMRPLICHASGSSTPGTARHRRIVHLEFAGSPDLPAGFAWHQFFRADGD